jgi:hypothetical protein
VSQFPDKIPESLRQLLEADQRGTLPNIPDEFFDHRVPRRGDEDLPRGGTVEELTGQGLSTSTTDRILLQILDHLKDLPDAIWDEIEGRG